MKVLFETGYPLDIVKSSIHTNIVKFNKLKLYGSEKFPSICNYLGLVRFAQDLPIKSFKMCSFVTIQILFSLPN